MRRLRVHLEHEGDAEPLGGGVEDQLAGIEMVDRRRLQVRQADRLAPVIERVGHVAVEEDGGAGELGRLRSVAASASPPIATTRLLPSLHA